MGWSAAEMAEMNAHHARMEAAFKLVEPASHWKAPIDAVVPAGADLGAVLEAIEFFTATRGSVAPAPNGGWRVTADGYWAGPAN